MRRTFADALLKEMQENDKIYLLVGDLGYKVFDSHFAAFPDRAMNCGASEQAMMDIAVGLALSDKIPFVYTITPFLLRGYETIRTYINHEKIAVHMVGSGRDHDYGNGDGFSHDAADIGEVLAPFKNITQYYPETKEEIPDLLKTIITSSNPTFLSLRR